MMERKAKKQEFVELYDRYSAAILRHIYFRISSWETAEDLTQEAFLKAWNYVANQKKEIDNPKTFIYAVANNLIIDHYRRKPRIPVSIENIDPDEAKIDASQASETDRMIDMNMIKKALNELDENYRQIVIYRYIDDLGIEEIQKITGKSANNISVILYRALKILKEKIIYGGRSKNN